MQSLNMQERIAVGIIGATGQTGRSVVTGLILSETPFVRRRSNFPLVLFLHTLLPWHAFMQ